MPGQVGALILSGVPLLRRTNSRKPAFSYRMIRQLNEWGLLSDDRLETEKRKRGSADYRAASGVMRDILVKVVNEEYPEQLQLIRSPVHMIWGADDDEVPVAVARDASQLLGDCQLEVLDGVGHHVPIQAPKSIRRAVDALLT